MNMPNSEALSQLKSILQGSGIRAALIFLNSLTSHRFSALYRFDLDILHNLYLYDRENPDLEHFADIPINASYCIFVKESGQGFSIEHAMTDERVVDHPKRNQIQFYCGIPLFDKYGVMRGTMCHFNIEPTPISDDDIYLMEGMAGMLHNMELLN